MRFLVAGSSLPEVVIQEKTGRMRRHIGGVAGIMARELAREGADVTLVVNAIAGEPAEEIVQGVEKSGVKAVLIEGDPKPSRRASAAITVRNGNPVKLNGNWNRTGYMGEEFKELCVSHDWLLAGLSLDMRDLTAGIKTCANVAVNATSTRSAPKALRLKGITALTMNARECQAMREAASKPTAEAQIGGITGAQTVMVTLGSKGHRIHQHDGTLLTADAPTPPEGTDYIGAGDAATAGLVYALAHGLELEGTVQRFISRLMEGNAQAYR